MAKLMKINTVFSWLHWARQYKENFVNVGVLISADLASVRAQYYCDQVCILIQFWFCVIYKDFVNTGASMKYLFLSIIQLAFVSPLAFAAVWKGISRWLFARSQDSIFKGMQFLSCLYIGIYCFWQQLLLCLLGIICVKLITGIARR